MTYLGRPRGGNLHPLSSRQFILDHLAAVGEDYCAEIHRAYRARLDQLAIERGRKRYHRAVFGSFNKVMNGLTREGLIEATGRTERSDHPMFKDRDPEEIPLRYYYKLTHA